LLSIYKDDASGVSDGVVAGVSGTLRLVVERGGDASPAKVNAIVFDWENLDYGV